MTAHAQTHTPMATNAATRSPRPHSAQEVTVSHACPLPASSVMRCKGPAPCGHCTQCKWPYDLHNPIAAKFDKLTCPKL